MSNASCGQIPQSKLHFSSHSIQPKKGKNHTCLICSFVQLNIFLNIFTQYFNMSYTPCGQIQQRDLQFPFHSVQHQKEKFIEKLINKYIMIHFTYHITKHVAHRSSMISSLLFIHFKDEKCRTKNTRKCKRNQYLRFFVCFHIFNVKL